MVCRQTNQNQKETLANGFSLQTLVANFKPEDRFSQSASAQGLFDGIWVWLKNRELGLRAFLSLVPFTKVPILAHVFEPQPYTTIIAT